MPKKKIIAAFKTHFDFGYTDRKEIVLGDYCGAKLRYAMDICEATQVHGKNLEYKWTLPAFLLMQMYRRSNESDRVRLIELVQRGQLICHALPFTMHTSLLDKQLAEKMFIWTDEYVATFQKQFPISAKMTDVPGHTSGIIEPLVKRGVKFLHLGKNGASTAPDVPLLFWWEDLKGNRILTMYNQLYGSQLIPPKGWKYPVWLALCHTNDNVGAHKEDIVLNLQTAVGKSYDFQTGSLDDFANEILKCDLSDLPVIKGELSDTWVHGVGSYPDAVACFRESKTKFYELEKRAGQLGVDISKEQEEFYKYALVYTEHTFGVNVMTRFPKRVYTKSELNRNRKRLVKYKESETSWADERAIAFKLKEICDLVQKKTGYIEKNIIKEPLTIETDDKYIYVNISGKRAKIHYEYCVFGAESVHGFAKKYLTRFIDWSISDFGKLWYPEIEDKRYIARIANVEKVDNTYEILFRTDKNSFAEYGNFKQYKIKLFKTQEGIQISFYGTGKDAINLVEAGNFVVDLEDEGKHFLVQQIGQCMDVNKDIIKNSNQILWAMDEYAEIDGIRLYSHSAPLVAFERNAICQFNCVKSRKKKAKFVINLFNNHWGTNFPQWMEGDYNFNFTLTNCNDS